MVVPFTCINGMVDLREIKHQPRAHLSKMSQANATEAIYRTCLTLACFKFHILFLLGYSFRILFKSISINFFSV